MRRLIVYGLIVLSLAGCGSLQQVPESELPKLDVVETQSEMLSVVVQIDTGEKVLDFAREVQMGTKAFDLLQLVTEEEDIDMEVEVYDFGVLVTSLDGKMNSAEFAWIYYVNGDSPATGASDYQMTNGDVLLWKYQEPIY